MHLDIKKQGRTPDGGGWRVHGRGSSKDRRAGVARDKAARAGATGARGYRYLHHAVDDYSRVAYSEILDDERKETAAGFWERANAFFAGLGVSVTAVMTDNGACYRSHAFAAALGEGIKQAARTAAYDTWLLHYNHHRPHTGIDGQTPSTRVHNVTGKYT